MQGIAKWPGACTLCCHDHDDCPTVCECDRRKNGVHVKRNGEVVVDLADRIKAAILDGAFKPGDSLPEATIVREFGCSRTSAREALRLVIHSGLAVKAPNQSYRIAQFDANDLNELTSLRLLLEQQAARLAFGQEAMLDGMGAALDALRAAVAHGDRVEAIRANRNFHEAMINASGHRRLMQAYWQLSDQIEFAFMTLSHLRRSIERLVPEHESLYELARTGTLEAFLAELTRHIDSGLTVPVIPVEARPANDAVAPAPAERKPVSDIGSADRSKIGQLRW